jgi:Iodothyronine deiodinase
VVYIEEAHPVDAWQESDNIKAHIFQHSTRTIAERCNVAGTCLTKLGIEFPAVVDGLSNTTERAYTAWPDRLYVIDRDGRIAYKSQPGPYGFKPDEVATTLARFFPPSQAANSPLPPAPQAGVSPLRAAR